jgi:hypothetical protein
MRVVCGTLCHEPNCRHSTPRKFRLHRKVDRIPEQMRIVHSIIVDLHDPYLLPKSETVQYLEVENRGYAAGLNRAVAMQ